jgi:molybdopterin biosynthesis enzyme
MAEADALIRVPADSEGYAAGASVDAVLLAEL